MSGPDYDQIARELAKTHASPYPPAYIPKAAEAIAAALRAAHAAGVAAEKERCAGVADEWASIEMTPQYIAAQIRQGE